jgi:hypothetical protein
VHRLRRGQRGLDHRARLAVHGVGQHEAPDQLVEVAGGVVALPQQRGDGRSSHEGIALQRALEPDPVGQGALDAPAVLGPLAADQLQRVDHEQVREVAV